MPKRPRTSESVDATSLQPSTSKWSLKRFSKVPQVPSRLDTVPRETSTASSSSPTIMHHSVNSGNRGVFEPAADHHYLSFRDTTEEEDLDMTDETAYSGSKNQDHSDKERAGGRSPGATAKDLVTNFSNIFSNKLIPTSKSHRNKNHERSPNRQYETSRKDAFWSSHSDFTAALSLQESAPIISPRDEETSHESNIASGSSSSESNNSAHMSSPIHSPTPTVNIHSSSSSKYACDLYGYEYEQPLSLEDFEVLETLGTGTFGRVLLVRQKGCDPDDRRNYFAMKVLKKSRIVQLKQVEHINSEKDILFKTDHPFLVKMKCTFQDSQNCYMLMEFVIGGEIFTHLRRQRRFSVDVTRFYIATLVLAISYLHSRNIIYRDLKPENLLIDDQGYIKITDFGFAKELMGTDRTWTLCGTPEYLSPEVIQSRGQTFACDYWCLGILMYEMLVGHPPFFDTTPFGTYEKILAAKIIFPNHVDETSRDLINSLLTVDVSKRLGNLRGGAFDVMNHAWFKGVDWHMLLHKKLPAPIKPHQSHPSDSSNFEKYNQFDIENMPGLHLGQEVDREEMQKDPYAHLFSTF